MALLELLVGIIKCLLDKTRGWKTYLMAFFGLCGSLVYLYNGQTKEAMDLFMLSGLSATFRHAMSPKTPLPPPSDNAGWLVCFSLLALTNSATAAPEDAVVRIPSHGGSGVVVRSDQSGSWFLTAGHMFETQEEMRRRIVINLPAPGRLAGRVQPGDARCVAVDRRNDLALLYSPVGNLPYVCPPANTARPQGRLASVGYDEMELPSRVRPANIVQVGTSNSPTWTDWKPRPGRSGGGLIDMDTGTLHGIVSGFSGMGLFGGDNGQEVQSGVKGEYASLAAIQSFLARNNVVAGQVAAPDRKIAAPPCPT